jgi:cellobiose phosphorylase
MAGGEFRVVERLNRLLPTYVLANPTNMRITPIILFSIYAIAASADQASLAPFKDLSTNMLFGTEVDPRALARDRPYAELLAKHFNIVVPENDLKFENTEISRGHFDFQRADRVVNFAMSHHMAVRGHVLVYQWQSEWLRNNYVDQYDNAPAGKFAAKDVKAILDNHIETVMGRYKGRIKYWDVVNEVICDPVGDAKVDRSSIDTILQHSFWYKAFKILKEHGDVSEDFVSYTFRKAHSVDPGCKLFLNDYGIEGYCGWQEKSLAARALVKMLLDHGVPIHGVGLQMHQSYGNDPSVGDNLDKNIQAYKDLGLEVQVTECDIQIKLPVLSSSTNKIYGGPTSADLANQAQTYYNLVKTCRESGGVSAFLTWGFTDKYSWIPWKSPGCGWALPFDKKYRPKPAAYAIEKALSGEPFLPASGKSQDNFGQSGAAKLPGIWQTDADGLPVFAFTAPLPVKTFDRVGKPYPLSDDPFFLLGNYRVTLFPRVSGRYQLMTGERSWARLDEADDGGGANNATLTVVRADTTNNFDLVGVNSLTADPDRCRRVFGTGYGRYDFTLGDGLTCSRVLSVPPSLRVNEGVPAFVVNVRVANSGATPAKVAYTESVLAHYVAAIDRTKTDEARLVTYTNRTTVDKNHSLIRADIFAVAKDPTLFRSRDFACKYDGYPPSLLLHVAAPAELHPQFRTANLAPGKDRLSAQVRFELQPGESREFNIVIGLAPDGSAEPILALDRRLKLTTDGEHFRAEWKRRLPDLSRESDPVFRREMVWDAYTLEAMATYSEYYHETYVPQGTAYDYEMDFAAAPRDHLQYAMALCYTDPALAKSCLRFVLKKMTSQGEIKYTDYGFGKTSTVAWNPSDQQLYLFMAVAEYLRITGDTGFLMEETQYLPTDANYTGTTLDKLDRAFMYLRDEVGTGPHGLIRLMNSDWSDMLYSDHSVLRYFWTAESHVNSAMALSILPELAQQLERAAAQKKFAGQHDRLVNLIEGIKRYDSLNRAAFYRDLDDRTFARRVYFNAATPFGDDVMHLEPQSFLLQAPDFPVERKRVLLDEIHKRLMDGEVLGPRQREKPLNEPLFGAGVAENGGYWYALAGPMIVGVGTFDKPAAWELLRQMTFDNFTRNFPDYWVGQWTAPDTFCSGVAGSLNGLPRTNDGGIWIPFAAYCAHAHSWPLYCYYRLKE